MINSFLPPIDQGTPHAKEDVHLFSDAWNMRQSHLLIGGGMTVALTLLAWMIITEPILANWHTWTGSIWYVNLSRQRSTS
jgi:Squalene epoxidase